MRYRIVPWRGEGKLGSKRCAVCLGALPPEPSHFIPMLIDTSPLLPYTPVDLEEPPPDC